MADYEKSLIKILEAQVNLGVSEGVANQRRRNHEYYAMQPMGNERPGRSKYVSPDVLDSVESIKGVFSETFFTGRKPVKFVPTSTQDHEEAKKRTAYVHLQLQRNCWTSLFRDGWHDAMVAKRMVVHVEWCKDSDKIVINLDSVTQQQLAFILQGAEKYGEQIIDIDTSKMEQVIDEPTGQMMYSGPFEIEVDRSFPKIDLIQPERFFRDPDATYVEDSSFCTWEMELPRHELIRRGFDREQVMDLKIGRTFRKGGEEDQSRKAHDQSHSRRDKRGAAESQDLVTVYKTTTWIAPSDIGLEEDGAEEEPAKLYVVWWAHGEILNWANGEPAFDEVECHPFFEWTEYKIAHAENGMCTADVLCHIQKVQSVLKRLILDNQQMRNSSRFEAVHSYVKNPRDLIDGKIGGVVWTKQIGSVAPLQTPELSPLTLQAIDVLDRDKEARSGMSGLAKGMNADAIKYQNAADMIDRLTVAGNRRIMKAARDFANTFFIPLAKYIYKLGARNDKRTYTVQMGGGFVPIVPSKWPDSDMPMDVAIALTPEECIKHGQTLLLMNQTLSADPKMQLSYGTAQAHAMYEDIFDAFGVPDSSRYMLRPDSPEYKQAAQQQQMMLMQQQKREEMMLMAQLSVDQSKEKREWAALELKKFVDSDRAMDRKFDNQMDMREFNWQQYVDTRKLDIDEEKAKQPKEPMTNGPE